MRLSLGGVPGPGVAVGIWRKRAYYMFNKDESINPQATPPGFLYAAAFKLRGLLMAPLVVFVLLNAEWEWEDSRFVWAFGLLFFLFGFGLRCWAQRHLQYRLRTGGQHHLAVTGPFAWCRNPVYIGNLALLVGIAVLCELIWAVPVVILWGWLVYSLAVRFEESRLSKRFGTDYVHYRDTVPRWFPLIRLLPRRTCASFYRPADWALVARAEWQCLVLLLVPVFKEIITHSCLYDVGRTWLVSFNG